MNKVYVFFGPPSSGKSYLGKQFAQLRNFTFYEADDDYLPEYRERVEISEDEKQKVYDEFYSKVISKVNDLLKQGKPVVVASALGKNKNRRRFLRAFKDDVVFVLIESETEALIKYAIEREFPELGGQLLSKEKEASLKSHLLKKISAFEKPDFDHVLIQNDYADKTLQKLKTIV